MFKKDKNNPRRSNVYLLMFCSVLSKFLKKVEGPTIGGRNLVAALCYLYYMNLSCAIFFLNDNAHQLLDYRYFRVLGKNCVCFCLVGCLAVVKRRATLYISILDGIRLSAPQKLFYSIMLLLYDLQSDLDQFCRKKCGALKFLLFSTSFISNSTCTQKFVAKILVSDFNTRIYVIGLL